MSFSLEDDVRENSQGRSIPKHELRARKSFAKLGLIEVPGVYRVVVRKNKQTAFVVSQPDVYKAHDADVYVVFGDAKVDDAQAALQQAATQAFSAQDLLTGSPSGPVAADEEPEDESGEIDESGLDVEEIEAVIAQTNCSRFKAVKALRNNDSVVDAIISLGDH